MKRTREAITTVTKDYGIRWEEITGCGKFVTKQKFFTTDIMRQKYLDKLLEKDSFFRILAYTA